MNLEKINTEVLSVLVALGDNYLSKLPDNLLIYLMNNSDKNYEVNIDINKPIQDQNISKEAIAILALIKLQYLCETEEEKEELLAIITKKNSDNEENK